MSASVSTTAVPRFDADRYGNEDLLAVYDFFGALRARMMLIAALSLLFGLGMTVLAYTMKPIYRGSAVMAPVTAENNPVTGGLGAVMSAVGVIAQLTGNGVSDEDRAIDEAMTVLQSQEFTEAFIKDNNLLPVLFPKKWDAKAGRWKPGIKKIPTLTLGYVEFDNIRKVDRDADNAFVTLQIDWPDRFQAAEWTNQLVDRLNEELRRRAIASANASLLHLEKELTNAQDVADREAISRLMETQLKKKMVATVTHDFELRFVDRATVPDKDFPVSPKKLLMIGAGLAFGALVGIAVSLWLYRRELLQRGEL